MKKLHIAFLDFDDIKNPLLAGGQARATFEVSRRLVTLGHRVTVVASRFPGSVDGTNEGIFYRHIGLGTRFIRLNNLAFFFALPFAVRKLRVNAIIECFTAPISTCFSPLFTRIPVIGMPTMFEAEQFAKKYHLPFHWAERLGARLYRYFLANSPTNKAKMESLNSRIYTKIIPNGVDEAMLSSPVSEGDYGFFIGRIDIAQKGLDLLVAACRMLGDRCPKILIAGHGSANEEAKLKKLIAESGLAGRVHFIGRVDGARKTELLANAKFGVYPSRFKDFPLVPLEYAVFGKPIVCFDVRGLRWVPHSVSLKAKPFDADDLARQLSVMNSDGELRAKLAGQCRPFAAKYGWNRIAEEYAEFCAEVMALERRRHEKSVGKRVLVLGGAGFIGSILSVYLYMRGDEVTIFDNLLYEKKPRSFFPLRFVRGDIRVREDLLPEIRRADVVVNLAAISNDPSSDLDPELTNEINHYANELIADLCVQYGKRIVFASSCSVYGFAESGTFTEDSVLNPVTLYAKTKVLSEKIYEEKGADVVSLRFATAYGYTEKPRFDLVVNTMIGTAYFDGKITVNGGDQWRPLVHVQDIAQAVHLVAHAERLPHRVYNVGSSDQNYRIGDLARIIGKFFPAAEVKDMRESVDGRSYKADFSRIERELGFKAYFGVHDAVKEFSEAFRANKVENMQPDEYYRVRYLKSNVHLADLIVGMEHGSKVMLKRS